ncbi:MAG: hypothetical protein GWN94_01525 [Phycisphaerae bacterium]|nr:hypothetical protein [Phycisphaerae bacterium]
MKKKTKKMALGGIAAAKKLGAGAIPTVAAARSLRSGKPEGILQYTPIGMAMRGRAQSTPSTMPSGPVERPERSVKGMRKGGRIDGCAKRGKTRGRLT